LNGRLKRLDHSGVLVIQSARPSVEGVMHAVLDMPRPAARRQREARAVTPDDAAEEAAGWLRAIAERGDRVAFVALYGRFAPRGKAYLLRLALPPAQAEELTQEAMLAVWRKAAQFDARTSGAATWIFTIARNLRVDAARRAALALREDMPPDELEPTLPADAQLDDARRADRLRQAMQTLPPEQAEVVRLAFFDDRPHAEIERRLGIPLGTVKSRLRLAMVRLRAQLDAFK
jgi:RNA polymerase sigma-70 factor (ECF subfamily)